MEAEIVSLSVSSKANVHKLGVEKEKDRENEQVEDRLAELKEKKRDSELQREINKGDKFLWKNNMKSL